MLSVEAEDLLKADGTIFEAPVANAFLAGPGSLLKLWITTKLKWQFNIYQYTCTCVLVQCTYQLAACSAQGILFS